MSIKRNITRLIFVCKLSQLFNAVSAIVIMLFVANFCAVQPPIKPERGCNPNHCPNAKTDNKTIVTPSLPIKDPLKNSGIGELHEKIQENTPPHEIPRIPNNHSTRDLDTLRWRQMGCIKVEPLDFFYSDSDLPEGITSSFLPLARRVVIGFIAHALLISVHLVMIMFDRPRHKYRRNLFHILFALYGIILWLFSGFCLAMLHSSWEKIWTEADYRAVPNSPPVVPQFPMNWIMIELMTICTIINLALELCMKKRLYSYIRFVYPMGYAESASLQIDSTEKAAGVKKPDGKEEIGNEV